MRPVAARYAVLSHMGIIPQLRYDRLRARPGVPGTPGRRQASYKKGCGEWFLQGVKAHEKPPTGEPSRGRSEPRFYYTSFTKKPRKQIRMNLSRVASFIGGPSHSS